MRAADGRSNARPERAAEGSGGPVRNRPPPADWGGESETGRGIARLFRYPQVLDVVAPNDELGQLPEAVAVTRGADHVAEADVHPVVAADKVAVVGLAILELDEHRVPLRRSQERERQHHSAARRSGPRRRRRRRCAQPSAPRGGGKTRTYSAAPHADRKGRDALFGSSFFGPDVLRFLSFFFSFLSGAVLAGADGGSRGQSIVQLPG